MIKKSRLREISENCENRSWCPNCPSWTTCLLLQQECMEQGVCLDIPSKWCDETIDDLLEFIKESGINV